MTEAIREPPAPGRWTRRWARVPMFLLLRAGQAVAVSELPPARRTGRRLRGVVFDLDDTLTRAEFKDEMWARTVEHVRAVLPDVDGEGLRRRAGAGYQARYAEVLAGVTDPDAFWRAQLAAAAAAWGELSEETLDLCLRERGANLDRRRPAVGAAELIDRLRAAGLRVGLLTNGPTALQRRKLAATGLDRLLDAVAISQEIGVAKPAAAAYLRAAELLGCPPGQTAMVGDQLEWDVEGSLRAGYRLAILVGGRPVARPRGAVQVRTLNEVARWLLDA